MIFGIDNGLDGGIVQLDRDGNIIDKSIMPTTKTGKTRVVDPLRIADIIRYPGAVVIMENASKHAMGVLSLCSTWRSLGRIETVVILSKLRHEIVDPKTWQRVFWTKPKMPKGKKFDTKAAALQVATRLWPDEDWIDYSKSNRKTKAHDGMVDAALIAEFGRRKLFVNTQ